MILYMEMKLEDELKSIKSKERRFDWWDSIYDVTDVICR